MNRTILFQLVARSNEFGTAAAAVLEPPDADKAADIVEQTGGVPPDTDYCLLHLNATVDHSAEPC